MELALQAANAPGRFLTTRCKRSRGGDGCRVAGWRIQQGAWHLLTQSFVRNGFASRGVVRISAGGGSILIPPVPCTFDFRNVPCFVSVSQLHQLASRGALKAGSQSCGLAGTGRNQLNRSFKSGCLEPASQVCDLWMSQHQSLQEQWRFRKSSRGWLSSLPLDKWRECTGKRTFSVLGDRDQPFEFPALHGLYGAEFCRGEGSKVVDPICSHHPCCQSRT
jgi:hypothetical protein